VIKDENVILLFCTDVPLIVLLTLCKGSRNISNKPHIFQKDLAMDNIADVTTILNKQADKQFLFLLFDKQ
jgi:hypothetical protein